MSEPTPYAADLAAVAADLARCAQRLSQLAAKLAEPPKPIQTVWDGPPEWVDTKQAAKILGISAKGLESLRCRGAGPKFSRIGKRVRYRLQDLHAALTPK